MSSCADSPVERAEATRAPRVRLSRHVPAIILFAVLPLLWTFPLVLHLATRIPGVGSAPGDNVCFVWNLWWARQALHQHVNPFYTTSIFYPVGADLTQHTHTALSGAVGATLLAPLSPIAAQNILLLASLFLNALTAYLLAHRLTRDRFAAICAGISFGGAAPVLVRLYGHFNLVSAWVIPLAVLAVLRALDRRTARACLGASLALAAAAYSDYYYLVYAFALAGVCVAWRWYDVRITLAPRRHNTASSLFLALVLLDLAVIALIALTGGFTIRLAGVRASMHTTFNERVVLGLLLPAWVLSRRAVMISVRRTGQSIAAEARAIAIVAGAWAIAALPLIAGTVRLVLHHDYTSQAYGWRSAPGGVDVASFVIGSPLHPIYGALTRRAYDLMGTSVIEGTAWVGAITIVAVVVGWRRLRSVPDATAWQAALVIFGLWSLGPYLNAFGTNVGFILPQTLLRYVPIVANARIPGRAMAVVALAAAMLAALALGHLFTAWSTRRKAIVVALFLLDVAAGPIPLYQPQASSVYARLREATSAGAVLELPLGLRDGFGEIGQFDTETLLWQTIHERPMLGGFVARLPERVKEWYAEAPVISTLLRLSDPACPATWVAPVPPSRQAFEVLSRIPVGYVLLDRARAPARLLDYVATLPLTRVDADGRRELYELRRPE